MSRPEIREENDGRAMARLHVEGMRCLSCVLHLESALEDMPDVLSATVDLAESTATVLYRADAVRRDDLVRAVAAAGYRVAPSTAQEEPGA